MHRQLMRFLKKSGLSDTLPPENTDGWNEFLEKISQSFTDADQGRYLLERSLELSSKELTQVNNSLRKISKTEIASERNKLKSVIGALSDGLFAFNRGGELLFLNDAAKGFLMQDTNEKVGKKILDQFTFHSPDDNQTRLSTQDLIDLLIDGKTYQDSATLLHMERNNIFVSCMANPIKEHNYVTGFILLFRDVTNVKRAEESIRKNEQEYKLLFQNSTDAIYLIDPDTKLILDCNTKALELSCTSLENLRKKSFFELHPEKDQALLPNIYKKILEEGFVQGISGLHHQQLDNNLVPIEISARVIELENGKFILKMVQDISERLKAESRLKLATKVFENILEGVLVTNAEGIIQYVNPAFSEITGFSAEDALGHKPNILKSDRHDKEFYDNMWSALLKSGRWQGEVWNRRKNGEAYIQRMNIAVIKNPNGETTQYASVMSDITDVKRAEEEIKHQAYHDNLTGLPNRCLFSDRLDQAVVRGLRSKQVFAVLLIDLDDFKNINDTLGHVVGDMALKAVGDRLSACSRAEDTVARLGGDEFTIILEKIENSMEVERIVDRVLEEMAKPFIVNDKEFYTTVSIGIAFFPTDGNTAEKLLQNADMAMYHVKDLGKNNFEYFSHSMRKRVSRRRDIATLMQKAIERNEFTIYYQPKLDVKSGRISGVEALLRWQRPGKGMVSPAEFILIAEENGLILQIGEHALRKSCEYLKEWNNAGFNDLKMAVNLSARQLDEKRLLEIVHETLDETGINPEHLNLEVTESSMMKDQKRAMITLNELKKLGVNISMDNFGTGYSSLSYLRLFPIDELKIDISLIRKIPGDRSDSAIVSSIISMAHALEINVVAEGVETQEQLDYLCSINCDEIQGYFFSRPIPPNAMKFMLEKRKLFAPESYIADNHSF